MYVYGTLTLLWTPKMGKIQNQVGKKKNNNRASIPAGTQVLFPPWDCLESFPTDSSGSSFPVRVTQYECGCYFLSFYLLLSPQNFSPSTSSPDRVPGTIQCPSYACSTSFPVRLMSFRTRTGLRVLTFRSPYLPRSEPPSNWCRAEFA